MVECQDVPRSSLSITLRENMEQVTSKMMLGGKYGEEVLGKVKSTQG